jgi:hypothetical protein
MYVIAMNFIESSFRYKESWKITEQKSQTLYHIFHIIFIISIKFQSNKQHITDLEMKYLKNKKAKNIFMFIWKTDAEKLFRMIYGNLFNFFLCIQPKEKVLCNVGNSRFIYHIFLNDYPIFENFSTGWKMVPWGTNLAPLFCEGNWFVMALLTFKFRRGSFSTLMERLWKSSFSISLLELFFTEFF